MKTILFDFDGTIADTIPEIYKTLESLSSEFGYQPLTPQEENALRDLSLMQIIQKLKFPLWKLPFLIKRTQEEMYKKIPTIQVIPGMQSVLRTLQVKGYRMGIITSSKKDSVEEFLNNNGLSFFDFLYTGSNLFGKERKIKKAMQAHGFTKENTIYVGDEARDIEAAKKIPVQSIAVTWGFNSRKILEEYNPDNIIDSPRELLDKV